MAVIDFEDPCAIAAALREAQLNLLLNGTVQSVRFKAGNGSEREISYGKTDASRLEAAIQHYQTECDKKNGICKRRRRVTIVG